MSTNAWLIIGSPDNLPSGGAHKDVAIAPEPPDDLRGAADRIRPYRAESRGCVRLTNRDAEESFGIGHAALVAGFGEQ